MNNIIYCKDCKYCDAGLDEKGTQFYKCLAGHSYGGTTPMDYCSYAKPKLQSSVLSELKDAAAHSSAYDLHMIPIHRDIIVKIFDYLEKVV